MIYTFRVSAKRFDSLDDENSPELKSYQIITNNRSRVDQEDNQEEISRSHTPITLDMPKDGLSLLSRGSTGNQVSVYDTKDGVLRLDSHISMTTDQTLKSGSVREIMSRAISVGPNQVFKQ